MWTFAGIFGLGMTELMVILLIALIIFGANKLPQLGRGLGEGIRNFKKGLKSTDETGPGEQLPAETRGPRD